MIQVISTEEELENKNPIRELFCSKEKLGNCTPGQLTAKICKIHQQNSA
jgi:hypothetical protein